MLKKGSESARPIAAETLNKLKEEMIIIEGDRIKNGYMKSLGKKIFILTSFILIGYLIFISIFIN